LAKRFEEENNGGRRISRLPPITIASEFAKARPTYFRSVSNGSQSELFEEEVTPKAATEIRPSPRPRSHYPQMVQADSIFGGPGKGFTYQNQLTPVPEPEPDISEAHNYFAIPRSQSPDEIHSTTLTVPEYNSINTSPPLPASYTGPAYSPPRSLLVPPAQASMRSLGGSPSIRAVLVDSSEDVSHLSLQFANSLDLDRPAPQFQTQLDGPRSPSTASTRSFGSSAPRPSFNFSRPISRQSRPSIDSSGPLRQGSGAGAGVRPMLDIAYRQDSGDSPLTPFGNDTPQTPVSFSSDEAFTLPDIRPDSKPSSYVYTKYTLGPKSKRESVNAGEFLSRQINWDDPITESEMKLQFQPPQVFQSHSPPSPALTSSPPQSRRQRRPLDVMRSDLTGSPRSSSDNRRRLQKSRPTTPSTVKSGPSTIKMRLESSKAPTINELSAETHLQLGIELHESGSLQESTYHLRLAAITGLPTAMLLYALACRHGWGMKVNAEEGVAWLQKAVDSSQLEVAEDEDLIKSGQTLNLAERKSHKAQFALSVYELGVSYMNGWGVEQDKSLAVRCFEIAGNWGDPDALAEAGYCYLEGIGCKKDTKRSASLYRRAEAKGITVAGNSWLVQWLCF
jgi:Sel1 repeat